MSSRTRVRIGVDLLVLSQFTDTGMVTYTAEILPRLFRSLPDCDWVLFSKKGTILPFNVGQFENVRVIHSWWMNSPWPWKLAGVTLAPLWHGVDVLFIPVSRVPLVKSCKVACFIHDVGYLTLPEYLDSGTLKPTQISIRQAASSADLLLTNSQFTKKEFCDYYHVLESRVAVTGLGYDQALFNTTPAPPERIREVLERYGVRRPYVLYLGVIQGRKNLSGLAEAAHLWHAQRPDLQLVLAGRRGWNCDDIYRNAAKAPELTHMPGRIALEDLPVLYANAECYVLPSFYEGFGMPVIESMACGTPNVLSNCGALPEVGGSAAEYFAPDNIAEMSAAILRVVEREELRQRMRIEGLERCAKFTWDKVGAATVAALRTLLPTGSTRLS